MKKAAPAKSTPSAGRLVYFNALPEETRLRLADCLHGRGEPVPLLRRRRERLELWALLFLLASGAGVATAVTGFSSSLLTKPWMVLLCASAMLAFSAVLGIVRARMVRTAMPYPQGVFVFAADLIETRGERLRIWSLQALQELRTTHYHTNGIYTHTIIGFIFRGRTIPFRIGTKSEAARLTEDLQMAGIILSQAVAHSDIETITRLDPLIEVRLSGDWERFSVPPRRLKKRQLNDKSLARPVAWPCGSKAQVFLTGALAGLIAGPPAGMALNAARDEAMFAKAVRARSITALEQYLGQGKAHAAEARCLLGVIAFEEARNSRSVSRLRAFAAAYPRSENVPAARTLIHELYQEALAGLTKRAQPACVEFMGRLFSYLEREGSPPLVVRFRKPATGSLSSPDRLLTQLGAKVAPFGDSFNVAACRRREGGIVQALREGFRQLVPEEILDLKPGAPLPDEPATETSQAVLEIGYKISASGDFYVPAKGLNAFPVPESILNTRTYTGISVAFKIALRVPGDDRPFTFDLEVIPPPNFTVMGTTPRLPGQWAPPASPADSAVYDKMAAEAFNKLEERLAEELYASSLPRGKRD